MDGQKIVEDEFTYITPHRQKAKEIASEKIFGWQPFSEEQVLQQRNALGHILNELQAGATGSLGSILDLLGVRKNQSPYLGLSGPSSLSSIPTISERRESLKERFEEPGYVPSPKTERIAEGAGLLGSFLGTPFPGSQLKHALRGAAIAPAIGETAKQLGAPEWAEVGLQNLALIGSSLKGNKNPYEIKESLYKQAKRALPQDAEVSSYSLYNWAKAMKNSLLKQGYNPKNNPLIEKINDILEASSSGKSNVSKLVSLKQSINDIMGDPELLKSTRKIFPKIASQINRTISKYGKENGKWFDLFKKADEMHAGLANSKNAVSFISKKIDTKNPLVWALLGVKKTAGALGASKLAEVSHRILTNKELSKYYGNIVKSAFQKDARAMNYYIDKLEKKIGSLSRDQEEPGFTYKYPQSS